MDGELTCDHLDGLAPDRLQVRRRSGGSGSRSRASRSTTRAAPTSTTSELPRRAGRRLPRRRRRPQRHAALLGADPAAARPAHRRPDPLRRLLRAARPRRRSWSAASTSAGVPDEVAAVSRDARVAALPTRRRVPTTRLTRPVTGPPAWAGESYLLFSFTASTPTRKRPRLSSSAIRRVTFLPAYLLRLTP